jgi:beta-xylosidase
MMRRTSIHFPSALALVVIVTSSCSSDPAGGPAADGGGVTPIPTSPAGDGGAPVDGAVPPGPDARPPGPTTYTNPILAKDFPDPFVLREGTTYYAFATNAGGKNVPVATSTDLATWSTVADALPTLPVWAKANASLTWAPSVLKRGARYVLYYTARSSDAGFQCIGRAVSETPQGPYVDDTTEPFICQVTEPQALCGSIDPSPFVASNGDAWLLWKSDENAAACAGAARLWTQRLGIDGLSLIDVPTPLLQRDRNWEMPLIEGPSMIESGNLFYLFYSGNWWESGDYGVGYAICTTPKGPCSKKTLDGPLVKSAAGALGPGGQEFFTDGSGKLWMSYHAWSAPIVGYSNGGNRSLRIDPIELTGGVPALAGPTTTARPL